MHAHCRAQGMVLLVKTTGKGGRAGDWRVPGADVDVFDADLAAVASRAAVWQLGAEPASEAKGSIVIQCGPGLPMLWLGVGQERLRQRQAVGCEAAQAAFTNMFWPALLTSHVVTEARPSMWGHKAGRKERACAAHLRLPVPGIFLKRYDGRVPRAKRTLRCVLRADAARRTRDFRFRVLRAKHTLRWAPR